MDTNHFIGGNQLRQAASLSTRLFLAIKQIFSTHLFLIPASFLAVYLLLFVPQVYHVWAPPRIASSVGVTYWVLLIALAFVYLTTLVRFVVPEFQFLGLFKLAGMINSWLGYLIKRLYVIAGNGGLLVTAGLFVVSGVVGLWTFDISFSQPYLMFGSFIQIGSLWLVGTGVWLFIGSRLSGELLFDRTVSNRNRQVYRRDAQSDSAAEGSANAWQGCGEALAWVGALGCLVEFFWVSASLNSSLFSYRLYTVSSLIHFCVLLVVLAALIDYVQNFSVIPARLLVFLIGMIGLMTAGSNLINDRSVTPEPAVVATQPSNTLDDNQRL